MTLRKLTTPHGDYFVCCVTPFHGQVCPECKTLHENPVDDAVDFHEALALEVAAERESEKEEDTLPPVDPAPTTPTSPSAGEGAQEGAEIVDPTPVGASAPAAPEAPAAKPAKQPKQPKN